MAKALVVEDNLLHGRTVVAAAQALGHEAHQALTLDQGLRAAKDEHWDVVFLDASLPDGDGLAAASRFAETLPQAKLLAMVRESELDRAKTSGFTHVLAKPLSPAQVADALRHLDAASTSSATSLDTSQPLPTLKDFRDHTERDYLEALIAATDNDVAKAMETAGISRAGYYNLLKKHGLTGAGREE